jgi:hypothetical protein
MAVLATTFAVALICYGLGSWLEYLVARRLDDGTDAAAYRLLAGWALASLIGVLAAVAGWNLIVPALVVGVAGGSGLSLLRLGGGGSLIGLLVAWALCFPLIWIAGHTGPTTFDEFTHWLPNARYLVERDAFADAGHPNVWSAMRGYPPALTLIGYGAERLAGSGFAVAPKIFNIMLAGAFALALASLLRDVAGRWFAIAAGVAAATLLNPFFDPRTAITAHPDVASGLVLAMGLAACWRAVEHGDARSRWQVAASGVLLVLLRETGIVLGAGLGLGLLLLGHRGWRVLGMHAGCSLAAFACWRLYLVTSGQPSVAPRPLADWDWSAPWVVLRTLLTARLADNPLVGAAALVVVVVVMILLVARIHRSKGPIRDLAILYAAVAVTWVAFIAWSYAAVFNPNEIATANSAWRYVAELGPSLILVCVALVAAPWSALSPRTLHARWAGALACVLVPAGLLITWRHWRLDCTYPDVPVVRRLAHAIGPTIGDDPAGVVHPTDASGYDRMIDYELHRPLGASVGVARADRVTQPWLIDLSGIRRDDLRKGQAPSAVTVMRRAKAGWQPVLTIPAGPSRVCRFARQDGG